MTAEQLDQEFLLASRLHDHARCHEAVVPFDGEQLAWTNDLRLAAHLLLKLRADVLCLQLERNELHAELELLAHASLWGTPRGVEEAAMRAERLLEKFKNEESGNEQ